MFPGASAVETDEFEPVSDFIHVTVRWNHQRPGDRDNMSGHEMERAVTATWENVDGLLEKGLTASVNAEA
jgi:hypothetical protein